MRTNYSASFDVTYNNGLQDQTKQFNNRYEGSIVINVTAANGYKITKVDTAYYKMPYGSSEINMPIQYQYKDTKIDDTHHTIEIYMSSSLLGYFSDNPTKAHIIIPVTTEKEATPEPTINLQVTYNNGVTTEKDTFNNQKAGTISGTVTAGTGYTITGVTGAYYRIAGMATNLKNFNATKITDTKYTYSFILTNDDITKLNRFNTPIRLKVETEEQVTPISIDTSGLKNCTVSPSTINQNEKTTVTLMADSGYILNGSGTCVIDGKSNNFTCSNVSSYQFNVVSYDSVSISFMAAKIEPSINLKVTYNNGVETVTDTFNNQKAGTITGTIKAGTGYIITEVTGAYYNIVGELTSLKNFNATKVSNYKYSYSFDLTNSDIEKLKRFNTPIKLRVETEEQLGNIDIDSTNLEHCSVFPSTITQGKETVLTLNADSGYILNGTGNYSVDGTSNNFTCDNVSSYQITVTAETSVSISFVATKVETKPSSIVHTYVLDQEDYNNLGKQIIRGVNSTATGFEQYDYTKFVNYLYEIPFKIGTEITTSTSTINLGKKNLSIDCQKVTHETLNIDLGSIDLTGMTNSHDYKPINITLYCPFSDNIVLPLTVINSKLYLSFLINLKSEQATLLIKQNNNVIYSGQTKLFTDLPLYFTAGLQDTLIKQFKTQYQNTIKQAYIIINYNKPITNLTSYKTTEHGMLSNYKGFTRVSRGTLKQSISNSIDNSILSLLSQGVIIK